MTIASPTTTITVALIGNPNTGKSTVFNALSGLRQRVGNYPGVTVEKKIGHTVHEGRRLELVDLPGTYSLAPRSLDEMLAVDVLLGRRNDVPAPDVVLCIVDASNLERNLYLVSQVLELGRPTVVALNMMDIAAQRGIAIDADRLSQRLAAPVIPVQANRKVGLEALKRAVVEAAAGQVPPRDSPFSEIFTREVQRLGARLNELGNGNLPRYLVERLLLDTTGFLEHSLHADRPAATKELTEARQRLANAGLPVPAVEAIARYGWVGRVLEGVVTRPVQRPQTWSDRLDRVLTHRLWGSLVFLGIMFIVFQSVFRWALPVMNLIDAGQGAVGQWVAARMPPGALQSLLVDGVIAGVGAVIIFLPQIFVLFFFLAILEDCGYMARAAYLMDKLMSRVGLSGKSFIPLLSSFACAIPGVMATRVIENRRDRLTTILVAPLMSCSARLPVYSIMIAAFVPGVAWAGGLVTLQGVTLLAMYLVGIVAAVVVALVLKRTLLRGATPPFVMELPNYKIPAAGVVLYRMFDRGMAFIKRAGTLIFAASIVVWALLYYPRDAELEAAYQARLQGLEAQLADLPSRSPQRPAIEDQLATVENELAAAHQRNSFLGRAGHWIEPAVRPLGWDWRIGCAAIASFPAREVVVSTLGVLFSLGPEVDPEDDESRGRLIEALRGARWADDGRPLFSVPVALSLMVFFALCAQCVSTLAVIKRETNSWWWPAFTFAYMTVLAYVSALATYQIGTWLGGGA